MSLSGMDCEQDGLESFMARIAIIDPRGWQGAATGYRPSPNVGIAYLIPLLRRSGHDLLIIDLNNEPLQNGLVMERIKQFDPDVLGLSAKTATIKDARSLAQQIKNLRPSLPIVLGGPHTIFAPKTLAKEPFFDVVFVGEGERAFPEIVASLNAGSLPETAKGVLVEKGPEIKPSIDRPLLTQEDLESIPFPEYDLFPENVRQGIRRNYPLITSRGCVHKCIYCSVPEISGKRVRTRSADRIIEELVWARKSYGAEGFEVIDDVFNIDMDRCKEFCHALIRADLSMPWSCPNGIRADRLDSELAGLMRRSGCSSVMLGIETADPTVLATVRKGETIEEIEEGIRILQGAGIKVGGYFIIGLPGDSLQSQKKSVEFAKRMAIGAHFNMLIPYPGTAIWEWAKTNAKFISDIENGLHFADDSDKLNIVFETDDFTAYERKRAYEMTHTLLGRFDMLIPRHLSHWEHLSRRLNLLWEYDKLAIPSHLLRRFWSAISGTQRSF